MIDVTQDIHSLTDLIRVGLSEARIGLGELAADVFDELEREL